jgi:hypothetical protein
MLMPGKVYDILNEIEMEFNTGKKDHEYAI